MAKYILLDALLAEIEKKKIPFKKDIDDGVYPTYLCALMDFEDFINTLKAKDCIYEAIYKCQGVPYKERKFFSTLDGAEEYTKDFKDVEIVEHRVF